MNSLGRGCVGSLNAKSGISNLFSNYDKKSSHYSDQSTVISNKVKIITVPLNKLKCRRYVQKLREKGG